MSFDSIDYLVFLPTVWLLYACLGRTGQNRMLLAASYLFYAWWDPRFLFLIALSTSIDYGCGLLIDRPRLTLQEWLRLVAWSTASAVFFLLPDPVLLRQLLLGGAWSGEWVQLVSNPLGLWSLAILAPAGCLLPLLAPAVARLPEATRRHLFVSLSVVANLTIIGFFKYFGFFVDSAEEVARALGISNVELLHLEVVLPVGISFYTFQTMSYSLDIYRGSLKPTTDFLSFALFVSYFPQLVAGPIERASHLLPKILADRRMNLDQISRGLFLVLFGLFKKVGIANGVAGSVDSVFSTAGAVSGVDIAGATLLFAIQIYCDFSGYSDIARGTSKLLGIDLMVNFRLPYFSRGPSEFWRRWHVSLSTWLRDYLYISLGGNRHGVRQTYRNLMLTMVIGGLWHGAAWNFVLWGFFHGAILCIARLIPVQITVGSVRLSRLRFPFEMIFFFIVTCYGWLLFRAESLDQVARFSQLLLTDPGEFSLSFMRPTFSAILGIPVLLMLELLEYRTDDACFYRRLSPYIKGAIYATLAFITVLGMSNETTQFIYFQF